MTEPALAVMQPYFFPYLGYFSLVDAAEMFIFYDDVQWIKHGWINRNRILLNGKDFLFTVPVRGGSPNKLIREVEALADARYQRKFIALLESAYGGAPHFDAFMPVVQSVIGSGSPGMSELAIRSVKSVCTYLGIEKRWAVSSEISPHSQHMEKSERLIALCKENGYSGYVNPKGGMALYDKTYFSHSGIALSFLEPHLTPYKQLHNPFVAGLSVIDACMFLTPSEVREAIKSYRLI